jgi:hypothetical protein
LCLFFWHFVLLFVFARLSLLPWLPIYLLDWGSTCMLWGEDLCCCCVVSWWGVHTERRGHTHTQRTGRERERERERERTCGFCGFESRQQHSHYCSEFHPTEKEWGWRFSFLSFFLSFFLLGLFGFWLFLLHLPAFRSVWVFSFAGKWSIPFFLSSTWLRIFFFFSSSSSSSSFREE